MDRERWRKLIARLTGAEVCQQKTLEGAVGMAEESRSREELAAEYGQVWDSYELARDFDIEAFSSPFVVVVRKSDGVKGTVLFQHHPRFYWGFDAT